MAMRLTQDRVLEIFKELKSKLDSVQGYHQSKLSLYEGDYVAQILSVVSNSKIKSMIKARSSWARAAIDAVIDETQFDAFENDYWGVTRLLVECNGDRAILSARRNAAIGSCSYVAIMPRENDFPVLVPFTGAEATGVKELRGRELEYGIAVKSVVKGRAEEYYLFARGEIYVVNREGKVIDAVKLPVEIMPLVQYTYDEDLATKPNGRSLLSTSFKSALESNLNSLALLEQAGIANTLRADTLIVNGKEEDFSSTTIDGTIDTIRVLFNSALNSQGDVDLKQPSKIDTQALISLYETTAVQCSVALGVTPGVLGLGDGDKKVLTSHRDRIREAFASSTQELAEKLFVLFTGNEDIDFSAMNVVYREVFSISQIGAFGDAIQKLQMGTLELNESFILRQLGIPLRSEAMGVSYPNVELSETMGKNFRALKNDIDVELARIGDPVIEVRNI